METGMKKIVQWYAIAGGAIPLLLLIGKFLELTINSETIPYSSLYGFYLWPTSILLLGSQDGLDLGSMFWLSVSIVANAVLYSIVGWILTKCGWFIEKWFRHPAQG